MKRLVLVTPFALLAALPGSSLSAWAGPQAAGKPFIVGRPTGEPDEASVGHPFDTTS